VTADRVQYLTDTQPGSSGAPVFDAEGRLIALHHRGGTPTQMTGKAPLTKNQGVRISKVHAGLKGLGLVT
jgi:V8-like Glu-specific endopeptidase